MLSRLGLVIHWATFLLGEVWVCVGLYNITFGGMDVTAIDVILGVVLILAFSLLGWVINFILSGHKSLLPWVANKEENNGR